MSTYAIALFLHIAGALGFFAALALEWTGLWQIRGAMTLDVVRSWMGILKSVRMVGFATMLTTVVTGSYMMVVAWPGQPWLMVTIGSLVLVIALSLALTGPRMMAVGEALAAGKGTLSKTFHSLADHPLLWISIQTRVAIVLGIVFLKITKPDLAWSLAAIGSAIVLGIASALPMPRRERVQEGSTD